MWINLSTSSTEFASLYLQLHSWVDCIEPFNSRVITTAHRNLFLNEFRHLAARRHLKLSLIFSKFIENCRFSESDALERGQASCWRRNTHCPVFPTVKEWNPYENKKYTESILTGTEVYCENPGACFQKAISANSVFSFMEGSYILLAVGLSVWRSSNRKLQLWQGFPISCSIMYNTHWKEESSSWAQFLEKKKSW